MITSIRLENFKNFADETLRLGPFSVIVGANASGKSNVRDAFRFLHGIGRGYALHGYTLSEIIHGKYGAGGQMEWAGIRGAPDEIIRFKKRGAALGDHLAGIRGAPDEIIRFGQPDGDYGCSITVGTDEHFIDNSDLPGLSALFGFRYSITVGKDPADPGLFKTMKEKLIRGPLYETIYTSHPGDDDPVNLQDDDTHLLLRMGKTGTQKKYGNRIMVRPDQPALTQIREHRTRVVKSQKDDAEQLIGILAGMRFLDLVPDRMRQPAFPGQTVLGDRGENLPTVLQEICADPERRGTLTEWIRELTPMDVRDFEFPTDPITGRIQVVFKEANGRRVSAYSASDGTLRFLALLAALLGENPVGLYFFEEIENGIHPSRMRLLIDLVESQTEKGRCQVVATTHSPDLLALVNDKTFENTSIVYRDENSEDGIIRPVAKLPKARELRRSQGLGRLHTAGWMEDILAFTKGNHEGQEAEG